MENILFDFISNYMPLTEEEKKIIIDLDIFQQVKKGTILLEAGEHSKEGYFVLQGCLRKYYVIDGDEKTTSFYTELEGETPECVATETPSTYYISCVEDSIITVSTPEMEALAFAKFPRFETLCRLLSEELLTKIKTSFDSFKNSSPEQRYLQLLEKKPDLMQRVPQHQLASYLGITPQSLSRLRARLLEKKI
ncbi:MAG: CRP-like cAMP-binding protein [Arenicella sp.]|jgi:CRP-like cAMP-binding protein